MAKLKRIWLRSLLATVITGVSSAGLSVLGAATASGLGFKVDPLNWRQLGTVMLTSGLVSLFTYLAKSPLPPTEEEP